jgi:predicted metalloprotease
MDARRSRGIALVALLATLSVAVTACGDDDSGGDDSPQPLTAQAGSADAGSMGEYDEAVEQIAALLDEYWAETLPEEFDVEYAPADEVIPYDPDEGSPKCGGEPLGPGNAFYCSPNNTIAWDEPGLMVPFYEQVGDAAIGFVMAHEWGHLVQSHFEGEFPLTVEEELNADCLAGTFAGALQDDGLLEGGETLEPGTDLYEAAVGIYDFGDSPDVDWQDPQAHGQPEERLEAFEIGYEGGVQACAEQLGPGFTEDL